MSNSNEPRRDCTYYRWGGGFPRDEDERCWYYGVYFFPTTGGTRPSCARCPEFSPRGQEGSVLMMLQSRLAEAEQRADLLQQIIDKCRADHARLAEALDAAARSLETIASKAGSDEYMNDLGQIRGYARNRAEVARRALGEGKP